MANDPFPNTSDRTMEMRLATLFEGSSSILVVPTDPLDRKENMVWLNTTERKLKIYAGGVTWMIGAESA